MGDCVSKVEIPTYNNDTKSNYEGHSGNQYQYDLNKPSDKNEYSLDLEAQRRDQIQGGVDAEDN